MTKKSDSTKPEDNDNDENKKRDCWVNAISVIVCGISIFLLAGCIVMFFKTCLSDVTHKECDHKWMELRDEIYADAYHIDTIFATRVNANEAKNVKSGKASNSKGSLKAQYVITVEDLDKIKEAQKNILVRQDRLADDVRQETNNMINKLNGWLSFWIGVMAILGVFVPIALQFKLYRETRDNDERIRADHEKASGDIEAKMLNLESFKLSLKGEITDHLDKRTQVWERWMEDHYHQMRDEIADNQAKFSTVIFAMQIKSFQNISDCPEVNANSNRDILLAENWNRIIETFGLYVNDYSKETPLFAKTYDLSIALVQIASVLSAIRVMNPRRSRRLSALNDEAFLLIQNLNDIQIGKSENLDSLFRFRNNLSNFHPFPL